MGFAAALLLLCLQEAEAPKSDAKAYRVLPRPGFPALEMEAVLSVDGRTPKLRIRGTTTLPDRTVLTLEYRALREVRKGAALVEEPGQGLGGALARVEKGKFKTSTEIGDLPRVRLVVSAEPDNQSEAVRLWLKYWLGPKRWEMDLALPDVCGGADLAAELDAIRETQAEIGGLILAADGALDQANPQAAWQEHEPRLWKRRAKLEAAPFKARFPLAQEHLLAYAKALMDATPQVQRVNGGLVVPVGLTTPSGAPFSFDALRLELLDAQRLAAHEFLLWVRKDEKLGGRTPGHDGLLKKVAEVSDIRDRIRLSEDDLRLFKPR